METAPAANLATPHTSLEFRSRRGSWASTTSRGVPLDKEALAQALDEIHITASKQGTLTSFSDYDAGGGPRASDTKELVTGGLTGLYSRIRQSVVGGSPEPIRPSSSGSHGAISVNSAISGVSKLRKDVDVKRSSSGNRASKDMSNMPTSTPRSPRLGTERAKQLPEISDVMPPRASSPLAQRKPSQHAHKATIDIYTEKSDVLGTRDDSPARSTTKIPLKAPAGSPAQDPEQDHRMAVASRDFASEVTSERREGADSPSDDVKRDVKQKQQQSKRTSMHSEASIGSPVMKSESRGARQLRAQANSVESLRNASLPLASVPSPVLLRSETSSIASSTSHLRPLARIAEKGPPTTNLSRTSSTAEPADLQARPASLLSVNSATSSRADFYPNLNGGFRRPVHKIHEGLRSNAIVPAHLKRRVVSKEFWMKDENARDCFYCGDAFSTFRRKHHCRTCGQIFDAKCTTLVSGRPFDLPGTLRLCRPCEGVIYGSDDDSTVFTDDEDDRRASATADTKPTATSGDDDSVGTPTFKPEDAVIATPSIGIPVSRRNRESKRRSAVLEFDMNPILARPGSSRSLKSLANRPRSSSHRRHPSKHQHMKSIRNILEERGPFHQDNNDGEGKQLLPAFHYDNIIDPDLAPFMSDEGSEDDQASIFTVLHAGSRPSSFIEADQFAASSLGRSSSKKGRSRAHSDRIREADPRPLIRPGSKLRKRNPSIASINFVRPSPRRSRSQTLMFRDALEAAIKPDTSDVASIHEALAQDSLEDNIKRSATMHGSAAPTVELNRASLQHVRSLLSQLLVDNKIPHVRAWERALMPILLQCTDDVDPDVQHGDDMDIRNYVKLKKVPGGRPGDTSYVSGVVFSRNISLKGMKRSFANPRLVIVTFAIEYARHNTHFMSLDPILAQEREYLRNLVGRIVALQPQVLLVQRNVSGLALQMLYDAGITVVSNVKESVLAAIARVTRTIMIKSVDKLSIDPSHLGHCERFDVKTYIHSGLKKTYIFISGCQAKLGCTIVLRGANTEALRQVKRVTEFMCYVVYNLKLETCLMRDEFVLIPSSTLDLTEPTGNTSLQRPDDQEGLLQKTAARLNNKRGILPADALGISGAQDPGSDGAERMDSLDDEGIPSQYRDLVKSSQTRLMSSSPFVRFTEPYLLRQALNQEQAVEKHKRLLDRFRSCRHSDQDPASETAESNASFEMVHADMLQDVDPAHLSKAMYKFLYDVFNTQYQKAVMDYSIKKKQWDSFFETSNGDPFDPFLHQNIFVLQSLVSSMTHAPCAGPEVLGLAFYADYESEEMNYQDDCTLGQFIEDICVGAGTPCKTCARNMVDHHRQYVHGKGQLTVSVTRYPSKIKGLQNSILMWSSCKICSQETTVIPMSDNTWKYSFGKYLELSFWSTPLKPRAGLCPHDIHKDFIRCFGFHDQCVRVQYDNIDTYEVIVPSPTLNWSVRADLTLKNRLYSDCVNKLSTFVASIKARLASINLSTVSHDKSSEASTMLEKLTQRAEQDHDEILSTLQSKYMASRFFEIVPLNRAIRSMDEKALAWDEAFNDFERNYFPSETDIRDLATLQLKKIFLDRPESTTSSDTEGVEMKDASELRRVRLTDDILQSEKAQNLLSAVVEEQDVSNNIPEALPSPSMSPFRRYLDATPELRSGPFTASQVEESVQRSDVKHLDLAIPLPEPDISSNAHSLEQDEMTPLPLDSRDPLGDAAIEEPKPLNPTLVEKIEQIRAAHQDEVDDTGLAKMPDSRIPKLAELRGKSMSQMPAPALIRAQTTPNHMTRKSDDKIEPGISKDTTDTVSDSESFVSSASKGIDTKLFERLAGSTSRLVRTAPSLIPRSVPAKATNDNSIRVSALARHFEQLSREFERERLKERRMRAARMRQSRPSHLMSSGSRLEVFLDASEAVKSKPVETARHAERRPFGRRTRSGQKQEVQIDEAQHWSDPARDVSDVTDAEQTDQTTDNERASTTHEHTASDTEVEAETTDNESYTDNRSSRLLDPNTGGTSHPLMSPTSIPDIELPLPKHEKSSLMKMLSSFWSERSASGWAPLEYPLHQTEHVFDDSDIIVREDEPSSVIALALSSEDYLKKVREFRQGGRNRSRVPESASIDTEAIEQAAIEASLVSETGTHMKYSFGHNQVRAQCKIFYAESFDALRRKCGMDGRFVESLSRSIKWDSKGGKTKSLFLKTLDDRFVIKSLQEVELRAFTRFAPDYFAFMSHTLFHGVPSVIAKMFGLFQVMIKNPATGVEFSSYLLVMENLFYDHKPDRRFDLKGSMRNRKIESTGQPDEVLLDENLVETIFETPLFVREHARKLLKASVWNDTMWLCKQNVMDYSLMAGFDDSKRQLLVGIIDCIRTYTWDKKLESWIKDRGKNKPTITSPRDYRNRFRVSMMQYVLQAPNVYHEFSRGVGVGGSLKALQERDAAFRHTVGQPDNVGRAKMDGVTMYPTGQSVEIQEEEGAEEAVIREIGGVAM